MKIPFIVVFLFLNISLSFSQTIQVLDETDKKPIPYVTVLLTSQDQIISGDYCDDNGFLKIDDKIVFDKVKLSCIGYESKVLEKFAFKKNVIFLQKKVINLDEVIISKENLPHFILGYIDLKKCYFGGIDKTIETVVFIENNANKVLNINSFLFKVDTIKKKNAIRIHFYKKRLDIFEPGEEILTDAIIEYLDINTQGLVEINIAKYGIEFPAEGCFVGIESLGVFNEKSKKYVLAKLITDSFTFEYNTKLNKPITFTRNRFRGKVWKNDNDVFREGITKFNKYVNLSFGLKAINK